MSWPLLPKNGTPAGNISFIFVVCVLGSHVGEQWAFAWLALPNSYKSRLSILLEIIWFFLRILTPPLGSFCIGKIAYDWTRVQNVKSVQRFVLSSSGHFGILTGIVAAPQQLLKSWGRYEET